MPRTWFVSCRQQEVFGPLVDMGLHKKPPGIWMPAEWQEKVSDDGQPPLGGCMDSRVVTAPWCLTRSPTDPKSSPNFKDLTPQMPRAYHTGPERPAPSGGLGGHATSCCDRQGWCWEVAPVWLP